MNQKWRQLEYVVSSAQLGAAPHTAGNGYGDVLVQVTLPMILALAILLFVMSSQYSSAVREFEKIGKSIPRDRHQALLDLQLQKLINALMQTQWEEERRLRLSYYIDNTALLKLDSNFRELCEQAYQIFSTSHYKTLKAHMLYKQVLSLSGLTEASAESLSQTDPGTFISAENKAYVMSQITGFLGGFESQIQAFQMQLIHGGFEEMLANPASHRSAKVKELVQKIRKALESGEDPTPSLTALLKHYTRELQDRLARDGYRFLPQTWQELKL